MHVTLKVLPILIVLTVLYGCMEIQKDCDESQRFLDCRYCPVESPDNPDPELSHFPNCAYEDGNGNIVIRDVHLKNILFDNDNLAAVYLGGTNIVYVNRMGKTARVLYVDNGADYFEEGLARTIHNGKIGFINKDLDIVIHPQFDFAFPFSCGVALVCNDCRFVPEGEYTAVVDGKWGYIDKNGNVIVPIRFKKEYLPPPMNSE